jgi:effector-binding domain-containing protein
VGEYQIDLVTAVSRPIAVSRGMAESWVDFASQWKPMLDGVWDYLRRTDLRSDGHNVMVYRGDLPTLEFEVGVEVSHAFEAAGAVVPSRLPEGRAVRTTHTGDYARLGDAYDALAGWCTANGQGRGGTRWEIYGDWDEDPNKMQTTVYWLLDQ